MSNEQRQAWQRFYSAALGGLLSDPNMSTETAHKLSVDAADRALAHYANLIPPKKERDAGIRFHPGN